MTKQPTAHSDATQWLGDLLDCLIGHHGPQRMADADTFATRPDLPTDGTAWRDWQATRQAQTEKVVVRLSGNPQPRDLKVCKAHRHEGRPA